MPLRFSLSAMLACLFAAMLFIAGCQKKNQQQPQPVPLPKEVPATPTYHQVSWQDLPATTDDELVKGFVAWRSSCVKLTQDPVWNQSCVDAATVPQQAQAIWQFLHEHLQPYSLRSKDGNDQGLITGYFEPVFPGSLKKDANNKVPVYGVPDDMIVVSLDTLYPQLKGMRLRGRLEGRVLKPYADAADIRKNGVKAPILAWMHDPMDLQFMQIQGSGRIRLKNGKQLVLGYADQNGYPYRPLGRWLLDQGLLRQDQLSMRRIRQWARQNPKHIDELLASNPSYVFFAVRPDTNEGPRGSLNVPLTAGYSVAIDRKVIPLGSLLWLSTSKPDGSPLVRPMAAQDTGGAIIGEVRADLFWGTGDAAGDLAGHMKQPGWVWLLWPKDKPLPVPPPALAPAAQQ